MKQFVLTIFIVAWCINNPWKWSTFQNEILCRTQGNYTNVNWVKNLDSKEKNSFVVWLYWFGYYEIKQILNYCSSPFSDLQHSKVIQEWWEILWWFKSFFCLAYSEQAASICNRRYATVGKLQPWTNFGDRSACIPISTPQLETTRDVQIAPLSTPTQCCFGHDACLYKSCCLQNNIERGKGGGQILIQ